MGKLILLIALLCVIPAMAQMSTRPLGTEAAGVSTSGDTALTVLSWTAYAGQPYWIYNGSSVDGYYKTTDDSVWQPFMAGRTFNLVAKTAGTYTVQVKRIPNGSGPNLAAIDAGVLH